MKAQRGLTLAEVLIAITILGILAGIALPTYQSYVQRSTLSEAFDALSSFRLRMDQAFHDNGNYGTAGCAVSVPSASQHFAFGCNLTNGGQGYAATATGSGRMAGYRFAVDHAGLRSTIGFPNASGLPANCWLTKPGDC
jgi:type IV pilus assembly protein PilE